MFKYRKTFNKYQMIILNENKVYSRKMGIHKVSKDRVYYYGNYRKIVGV